MSQTTNSEHEYPYRITGYHGETVAEELDTVPPLLNQEEIDLLAAHLSGTTITDAAVWSAFKKLPDSEHGAGNTGDHNPSCQKCELPIEYLDEFAKRFGYFYHRECVEDIESCQE